MEDRIIAYGGQAVIEGVLMRGQSAMAIAMRAPDGNILTHIEPVGSIYRSKITKVPFLRGMILLWDALGLGMRALTLSANTQVGEGEKVEGPPLYIALAFSIFLAIGIFFAAPAALGWFFEQVLGWGVYLGAFIEGLLRLGLLIGYIWLIGFLPDVKRLFGYHGAEHKTINAYESGAELTPDTVANYSVEHPRCGTAFLLMLVVFSVIFFSLLGPLPIGVRLLSRIIFIPVLAGVAVEYIRWTANHLGSPLVRLLIKPSLALQHLTTREPDRSMLEVAIKSFETMRTAERGLVT